MCPSSHTLFLLLPPPPSRYGPPVKCEKCRLVCAFNKPKENLLKVDGKRLCYVCTKDYKLELYKKKKVQYFCCIFICARFLSLCVSVALSFSLSLFLLSFSLSTLLLLFSLYLLLSLSSSLHLSPSLFLCLSLPPHLTNLLPPNR